jgi:hypothetical protein
MTEQAAASGTIANVVREAPIHLRAEPPTPDEWRNTGAQLAHRRGQSDHHASCQMWAIGDWLRSGEDDIFRHLKRARVRAMAAEITGYSRHTLVMAVSLARKIEPSMRIEELTWWHHLMVARLHCSERQILLIQALEHGWSVKTLREHLRTLGKASGRVREPRRGDRAVAEIVKLGRDDFEHGRLVELRLWWQREIHPLDSVCDAG